MRFHHCRVFFGYVLDVRVKTIVKSITDVAFNGYAIKLSKRIHS